MATGSGEHPANNNLRITIAIGAIVVLVGGLGWVFYSRSVADKAAAAAAVAAAGHATPVQVATAIKKNLPIYIEGLGNVLPLATVNVRTLVSGRLTQVPFKEGELVKAGQLLAQVDPRPYMIQLHQGEAALLKDSASLKDAQLTLERDKTLLSQNLVSQQVVDDQSATVQVDQGLVKGDEATIEAAKLNLDYARIVAPIDGVTGIRQVDAGNIINTTDATPIVTLTQLNPIAVVFTLPEDDLPRLSREMAKGVLPVDALSRDGKSKLESGSVALIDNEINTATATMRVKAVFRNDDHALWPSQFVKTKVLLTTKEGAVVIPAAAVQRGADNKSFVYVVKDNVAESRSVDVDLIQGEDAVIAKNLEEGEVVVTDGQNQIKDKSKVAPRQPDETGSSTDRAAAPNAAPQKKAGGLPAGTGAAP